MPFPVPAYFPNPNFPPVHSFRSPLDVLSGLGWRRLRSWAAAAGGWGAAGFCAAWRVLPPWAVGFWVVGRWVWGSWLRAALGAPAPCCPGEPAMVGGWACARSRGLAVQCPACRRGLGLGCGSSGVREHVCPRPLSFPPSSSVCDSVCAALFGVWLESVFPVISMSFDVLHTCDTWQFIQF